jgi:hypothetical protein
MVWGRVFMLPSGHPFARTGRPRPDLRDGGQRTRAVKDGRRPSRQRRVASLAASSTLLGWREPGTSACHDRARSAAALAHALAYELDAVGVADDAIEDGVGESKIVNDLIGSGLIVRRSDLPRSPADRGVNQH